MITDKLLRLSDAQAITGTESSDNIIDLSQARDIGEGRPLFVVFTIMEAFNTLTDLTIALVTNDDEDLTTTPTILSSKTVTRASGGLDLAQQHVLPIPPSIRSLGARYFGATYTVNGSNPSTGQITADIVETFQDGKPAGYPSGFSLT
jgi:hypothetical protein